MKNGAGLHEEKRRMRKIAQEARSSVSLEDRAEKSIAIASRARAEPHLQRAKTVLAYSAMTHEVDTAPLIDWCLSQAKRVALPVVVGEDLLLHEWSRAGLRRGSMGILEPDPRSAAPVPSQEIDVVVVPGVAFDEVANRLGHGRGFYDRLLKRMTHAYLIGLAFDVQIFESVPISQRDVAMDAVVTESRTIRGAERR